MDEIKLNWFTKLFIRLSPWDFFKYSAKKEGLNPKKIDWAESLFRDCKRIDIAPFSGSRGFIITLDNRLSLWFNQDGDCFKYDGFEMGPYDDGDVTVFDSMKE
jgi:hypothetical protein